MIEWEFDEWIDGAKPNQATTDEYNTKISKEQLAIFTRIENAQYPIAEINKMRVNNENYLEFGEDDESHDILDVLVNKLIAIGDTCNELNGDIKNMPALPLSKITQIKTIDRVINNINKVELRNNFGELFYYITYNTNKHVATDVSSVTFIDYD